MCVFFAVVLLFPVSMCLCPDVNKIHTLVVPPAPLLVALIILNRTTHGAGCVFFLVAELLMTKSYCF